MGQRFYSKGGSLNLLITCIHVNMCSTYQTMCVHVPDYVFHLPDNVCSPTRQCVFHLPDNVFHLPDNVFHLPVSPTRQCFPSITCICSIYQTVADNGFLMSSPSTQLDIGLPTPQPLFPIRLWKPPSNNNFPHNKASTHI